MGSGEWGMGKRVLSLEFSSQLKPPMACFLASGRAKHLDTKPWVSPIAYRQNAGLRQANANAPTSN